MENRPMMYIALSNDHRIVYGKDAVSFLTKIKDLLEDPEKLTPRRIIFKHRKTADILGGLVICGIVNYNQVEFFSFSVQCRIIDKSHLNCFTY